MVGGFNCLLLSLFARVTSLHVSGGAPIIISNNVQTRKIFVAPELPFILEADWASSSPTTASDAAAAPHDPLSSCYWPAASALARVLGVLASIDEDASDQIYLELGCGTGLCSLTAAASGVREVLATDVSPASLELTAAAAAAQNLTAVATSLFDATCLSTPLPRADVLLLSDILVTDGLAHSFGARVAEAVDAGFRRVLVVDPGRSTRQTFLDALAERGVVHGGFVGEDELCARARAGERVCLLDTEEGAPVSYCI